MCYPESNTKIMIKFIFIKVKVFNTLDSRMYDVPIRTRLITGKTMPNLQTYKHAKFLF